MVQWDSLHGSVIRRSRLNTISKYKWAYSLYFSCWKIISVKQILSSILACWIWQTNKMKWMKWNVLHIWAHISCIQRFGFIGCLVVSTMFFGRVLEREFSIRLSHRPIQAKIMVKVAAAIYIEFYNCVDKANR